VGSGGGGGGPAGGDRAGQAARVGSGWAGSPQSRRVRLALADAAVVVWVVGWAWAAVRVAGDLGAAAAAAGSLVAAGRAVATTSRELHGLAGLPFVGSRFAGESVALRRLAATLARDGGRAERGARGLRGVGAVVVGTVPAISVLVAYLPRRWRVSRDRRRVRWLVRRLPTEEAERLLAERALFALPGVVLRSLVGAGSGVDDDLRRRLARAELRRLGLDEDLLVSSRATET
jgi:hypothetical protein